MRAALGVDVSAVEIGQGLGRDDALGAAGQALVAAIGGDRLFGDLQVAAQLGQALLEPFGGPAVGLVLGVDLVGEIDLGDGVGDARRHRAVGAFHRDEDDEGAAEQRDAEMAGDGRRSRRDGADRCRRPARPARAGAGWALRRRGWRRRREQRSRCRCPELADRRQRAVEEARRLGAVELRIVRQAQLVDDAADEELGLDDLEFALDGAQVQRVDAGKCGFRAHHLERPRVEHDARRRLIHRRRLGDDQRHQRDRDQAAADDQRLAPIEQPQPLPELVRRVFGCAGTLTRQRRQWRVTVDRWFLGDLAGSRHRSHPTTLRT